MAHAITKTAKRMLLCGSSMQRLIGKQVLYYNIYLVTRFEAFLDKMILYSLLNQSIVRAFFEELQHASIIVVRTPARGSTLMLLRRSSGRLLHEHSSLQETLRYLKGMSEDSSVLSHVNADSPRNSFVTGPSSSSFMR